MSLGEWIAIAIAVIALGVSIWQGYETRKNYRLSAKPYIGITDSYLTNSDFVGIKITNNGLGPAIINDITFSFNSVINFNINQQYDFSIYVIKNIKPGDKQKFCFNAIDKNSLIMAGESINLLYLAITNDNDLVKQFHNVVDGSSIEVFYQSLYGDSFVFTKAIGITRLKKGYS